MPLYLDCLVLASEVAEALIGISKFLLHHPPVFVRLRSKKMHFHGSNAIDSFETSEVIHYGSGLE